MALYNLLFTFTVLAALVAQQPASRQPEHTMQSYLQAFSKATKDKDGRVTVPYYVDHTTVDATAFQGVKNTLVLSAPTPQVTHEEAMKHPELRDELEVRLTPTVLNQLKKLGVKDVATYFQGHTIRVTGKSSSAIYLCFPAVAVSTVLVERAEDITIIPDIAPKKPDDGKIKL
ncbi:MAG TPA: hypothetical protein VKU00_12960 [Chthonomonadaceae bacterium]|nr:hypothetical protein [Chthonomonadaceae bacterium]